MISSRPTIPLLVHADCLDGLKPRIADQQASLSKIESYTGSTVRKLGDIEKNELRTINEAMIDNGHTLANINETNINIEMNTSSIKTSSSNTATATSSLYSSVGTTEDASTSNTVIGLSKSIANKL